MLYSLYNIFDDELYALYIRWASLLIYDQETSYSVCGLKKCCNTSDCLQVEDTDMPHL